MRAIVPVRRALSLVPALLLAGAAAASESESEQGVKAAVAQASRAFSDAYVRDDTEALKAIYTEDAVLLPPGREIRGRDAVARYFKWGKRFRQIRHAMKSDELTIRGNTVIDVGTWHSTNQRGDEPPSTASGRYLVVWVREPDGKWRMQYDMWHRPVPAGPTKTTQ